MKKLIILIAFILSVLSIDAQIQIKHQLYVDSTLIGKATLHNPLGVNPNILTSGGGDTLNYYEVFARLHIETDSSATIDTIYLNTFPGTWNIPTIGDLKTGFEFNCDDCDGTVDFTNNYPVTQNIFPQEVQIGFTVSDAPNPVLYILSGTYNNGKSTVWVPYRTDGNTFYDKVLTTAYPYFMIHFRYYH